MPTEIYDRYQDHITPIYQEAAKQKRSFIPTSTDALVNYGMRQANEDAAQQLLTEGRLKESENYSQYLDKDLQARKVYEDMRRRTAQANREKMANIAMSLAQNDMAKSLANAQSINNGILEFRNKLAQDRQRKLNFMQQDYQILAQNEFNKTINELGKDYFTKFNTLTPEEKRDKYGNS